MLRKKEKIELTQELNNITTQLNEMEERQKLIRDKSVDIVSEIDTAEVAADAQDRELNIIVDSLKEIKEIGSDDEERTKALDETVLALEKMIEDRESFIKEVKERSLEEKEKLYKFIDEEKRKTGIAKKIREVSESYEKKADAVLNDIDKLSEFSGSISEMSLNAAIEAGRLGDAGMNFVRTAEDIRSYSEEFEEFVEKTRNNMEELKKGILSTTLDMTSLLDIMRDNSHTLTSLASLSDADDEAFKKEKRIDEADIRKIKDDITVLLENAGGILEEQGNIMEHIEKLGAHYIEENESLKKIKTLLTEIKES